MESQIMATIDVARRLNCSPDRVRQLEREGKLPAQKMPRGQRVFKAEDLPVALSPVSTVTRG